MRILGIERDQTACNYYRILQPLYKLDEHNLAQVQTIQEKDFTYDVDYAHQKIMEADVVVFQRPANENWLKFVKVCQKAGKVIILDYDDDPFETSPLSPAYRWLGTVEADYVWPDGKKDKLWKDGQFGFDIERNISTRDLFRANFKKADMVTTTTDILSKTFKKINNNTIVLPNLIDFAIYPKAELVKREVRIGWQGGSSHYEDLYEIIKPLEEILKKHSNVKFVYLGDVRFKGLFKNMPQNQIEFQHWVPNNVYPYKLALMNLDIGLCPLADNAFNRRKSAIKFFEYSLVGAATIASFIPPYSKVIRAGATGLLVKDRWFDAMETLILNKEKRLALARYAYDYVFENHNADKKAYLWRDAYTKVLERPLTEAIK